MWRLVLVVLGLAVRQSSADPAALASDRFQPTSTGDVIVGVGILVGAPIALPTGLSRGIAANVGKDRFSAQVAWTTATESSLAWTVTHTDVRARVAAALQHAVGRGTFGVRVGAGAALLHESRLRNQGARAGLMGDDLATSAYALLPVVDLDAFTNVAIAGPWLVSISAGPSLALVDGNARASWNAQLGVIWKP